MRGAHLNAIDRAGRYAQLASRALCCEDRVHELCSADDRIHWARRDALRAADAGFLDDKGHGRFCGDDPELRIDWLRCASKELRESRGRFVAPWRTLIRIRLAARHGRSVGPAARKRAPAALRLRQQIVQPLRELAIRERPTCSACELRGGGDGREASHERDRTQHVDYSLTIPVKPMKPSAMMPTVMSASGASRKTRGTSACCERS